jgi:transcriptional regulator with XRE-family HTH domain
MFFDIFSDLCKEKGISCKKAAEEIGLSNSITTKWKKTGATPNTDTLNKIAKYFKVSVDYLAGNVSDPFFRLDNQCILDDINSYEDKEKKPTQKGELDPGEIMFALSRGGEKEITAEMFEEVKRFAAYVAQRKNERE